MLDAAMLRKIEDRILAEGGDVEVAGVNRQFVLWRMTHRRPRLCAHQIGRWPEPILNEIGRFSPSADL